MMKKKMPLLLLFVAILSAFMAGSVFADESSRDDEISTEIVSAVGGEIIESGSCGDNVTYTLDDTGLLMITGQGAMKNYSINPSWTSSLVKTVIIDFGVTSIGNDAFYGCSNLSNVVIPDSVTSIGNRAFYGCSNLSNVVIPDSVTSIGEGAFSGCSNLTSIMIPEGVTSIGNYVFLHCSSITSITIPEGVTSIGEYAFCGCSSLSNVIIPDGVTSIGYEAFYGCSNLSNVVIPDSVTSIGKRAFSGCSNLSNVVIPDSVTSIGEGAFSGCSNLTSIMIPEGVTIIGNDAFYGCSNLSNVVIPDSVTSIGEYAFCGCSSLSRIAIPDSVIIINFRAFYSCSSLTSITIPDEVRSIGEDAFFGCGKLKKVLFMVTDENISISFGNNIFSSNPNIYCYMFTAPDVYFSNSGGYSIVYVDSIDDIRTINLPDDFHMACGSTIELAYEVFPNDNEPVIWTSSAPTVLSVENGAITALTLGSATLTATVGTASDSVIIETYIPATDLAIDKAELWLQAKESVTLSIAEYSPENSTIEKIIWSSSDTSRATVNNYGYVTTIKPGDVTITATTETGVTASSILHLTYPVSSVSLEPSSGVMNIDDVYLQLTSTAITSNGNYTNKLVSYTSNDETIATVDGNGLVTAVKPGIVNITAVTSNGKSASAEVTVLDHDWGEASYIWAEDNSSVTATRICR